MKLDLACHSTRVGFADMARLVYTLAKPTHLRP
jgi:hypothetical protein